MSETVYLGSGKTVTGQYGEFFNITLNLDKINENPGGALQKKPPVPKREMTLDEQEFVTNMNDREKELK